MAEGIKSARTCLRELKAIFEPTFGPYGRDVLLKSNTGTIYVTKNGLSILRQLEMKHPIGVLIKKSVENFSQFTGDFCKTYIIFLSHLIERLYCKYIDDISSSKQRELQLMLSQLSESVRNMQSSISSCDIQFTLKRHLKSMQCRPEDLSTTYFEGILQVSLANKYNFATKDTLKKVIISVIEVATFSEECLRSIIDNFENICVNVYGLPLSSSQIINGTIIERECIPNAVECQNCQFILLSGNLSRTAGKNISMNFTQDTSLHAQQNALRISYQKNVDILIRNKINVIFVEKDLPKHLALLCQTNGIIYVQHMSQDDLSRLASTYNVTVLSGLYDIHNIQDNVTGKASFFKSCTLGKQLCCHLGPISSVVHQQNNFQLLLCSPTQGMGGEYAEYIRNVLKILRQCFDDRKTCSILAAGGSFEFFFSKYFSELSMNTSKLYKTICALLADCFIEIPKLLFENSGKQNTKRFIQSMENFTQRDPVSNLKMSAVDVISGDVVDANDVTCYEPFKSKMLLLTNALELASQIIRIDMIVPVVGQHCKYVMQNMSNSEDEDEI